MASGDTKTQQYLDIAARGTRADLQRGCCNTRTQDLIMDVAERIITEEETRYREDQILQGEIDEIKNNPDVYDIVPTYAALQAYDTSGLTDKDIIRVLSDETHGGASTYYRWSTTTETFTYIGEVGDYYTKTQIDTLLDGKQDELTAGENITIEDESGALVISATDTTYSNFTGTDGTAAGTAGLVPAPATTDAGKFLKADGTWGAAGGGSGIIELTSADYDYHREGDTDDGVALWRLEPGMYVASGPVKVYLVEGGGGNAYVRDSGQKMYFISNVGSGEKIIFEVYNGNIEYFQVSPVGALSSDVPYPKLSDIFKDAHKTEVRIGSSSVVTGSAAVAIGRNSDGANKGAIALGAYSRTSSQGEMNIGATDTGYGYNNSNYRLLTGLYDPQSAHDAATKGYVDTIADGKQDELTAGTGITITDESGALVISATGGGGATTLTNAEFNAIFGTALTEGV